MSYKIYAAEVQRLGPPAVIITTAFENAGGYHRAECFLVVPGESSLISAIQLKFPVKSFEGTPVTLDQEFMHEEALNQAKIDLCSYLENRYKESPELIPPGAPNVTESSLGLLMHTWVRGNGQALTEILGRTEVESLRDAIHPILNAPQISRESL